MVEIVRLREDNREALVRRSEGAVSSVLPQVRKIVEEVRRRGDRALLELERRLDGSRLKSLRVTDREIVEAYERVGERGIEVLKSVERSIERFHRRMLPKEWRVELSKGVTAGVLVRAVRRVGLYVPGGQAGYPSTVLMGAVPARVAGVEEIYICTPPKGGAINPYVLVAADLVGVEGIFKVGGAQAIAAMAYGTETIPKVEKVVGPGNIYVQAAKMLVSGEVEVDFQAGPSEVMILADDSARASTVALELLAQAEHDANSSAVLVTPSLRLAREVKRFLEERMNSDTLRASFSRYSRIVLVRNLERGMQFANDYAPEHLVLMVRQPMKWLGKVRNAGEVFIGPYSAVAAGDFTVGPSHILPTGGKARSRSGLTVFDFLKFLPYQQLSREGLKRLSPLVERMAEVEGLPWHARSVRERLEGE
ncbi:MAG: histidinol dehydrogenase [Candidatus Hadarchaeales archaeon]